MNKRKVGIKGFLLPLSLICICMISSLNAAFASPDLPLLDIMFCFDLSGSMVDTIDEAKTKAIGLINFIPSDAFDVRFGVISYRDYEQPCRCCDHWGLGSPGGWPYLLVQHLTSTKSVVVNAINNLPTPMQGGDDPECHARIMFEGYSDPNIGWRGPCCTKIMIDHTDNVPHDCDLNEGVPGATGTWTTGCDIGPDETPDTGDDIDLQSEAIPGLVDKEIRWWEVHFDPAREHGGISYLHYWNYWARETGGFAMTPMDYGIKILLIGNYLRSGSRT